MIDREEYVRQGSPRKPHKRMHPYAAIDHRVIDSPAFADLTGSAVQVLVVMARQLTKTNNGHLQATFSYMHPRGIRSEHTLKAAIEQLISHGIIYRTRSHGANKAWARYAVTWLKVTEKQDLFLDGFVGCAWRYWVAPEKKAPRKNCRTNPAESAVSSPDILQKVQELAPQKMQTMKLVPCRAPEMVFSGSAEMASADAASTHAWHRSVPGGKSLG